MRSVVITLLVTVFCVTTTGAETKNLYYELSAKGYDLVLNMQFDEANKIFDEMIRMEPENALGYLCRSQSYIYYWQFAVKGANEKALDPIKDLLFQTAHIAEKMLDKNKDDIDAMFYLGSVYGNIGLYYGNANRWFSAWMYGRKAMKYMEEVIKKDPEYYNAYVGLGIYNYYLGVLPRFVKVLSFLLGTKGEREKGIEQLILASSQSDMKGVAKVFLAENIYVKEGNYKAAIPVLKELTTDYPQNSFLRMRLALCCKGLEKYNEAVSVLEEMLQKYPDNKDILLNLGWVYVDSSKFDRAFKIFEKIIEDDPTFSNSYYQMGRTSIISGQRLEEADKFLLKYLEMKQFENSPSEAWAHYRLGQVYEMTGRFRDAKKQYQIALRLDREHKEAREALERLK